MTIFDSMTLKNLKQHEFNDQSYAYTVDSVLRLSKILKKVTKKKGPNILASTAAVSNFCSRFRT